MSDSSKNLVDKDGVLAQLRTIKTDLEKRYAVSQIGIFGSMQEPLARSLLLGVGSLPVTKTANSHLTHYGCRQNTACPDRATNVQAFAQQQYRKEGGKNWLQGIEQGRLMGRNPPLPQGLPPERDNGDHQPQIHQPRDAIANAHSLVQHLR